MDAYHCVISKRDLRRYADRRLDRETLAKILEAGRRAGSARNHQPWEFVAVTQRDGLEQLARCGLVAHHLRHAQTAVVITIDGPNDLFDAGRCAQNMMLAAWALGVASCPVTLQRVGEVRRALAIPAGRTIAITIAFGYPHPDGRSRTERLALAVVAPRGRKPLTAVVHWERYGGHEGI
jgi:nitroreductase